LLVSARRQQVIREIYHRAFVAAGRSKREAAA
jgi:hypothetical protein